MDNGEYGESLKRFHGQTIKQPRHAVDATVILNAAPLLVLVSGLDGGPGSGPQEGEAKPKPKWSPQEVIRQQQAAIKKNPNEAQRIKEGKWRGEFADDTATGSAASAERTERKNANPEKYPQANKNMIGEKAGTYERNKKAELLKEMRSAAQQGQNKDTATGNAASAVAEFPERSQSAVVKDESLVEWAKEEEQEPEHSAKDDDLIPDPDNEVQDGPFANIASAAKSGFEAGKKLGGAEDEWSDEAREAARKGRGPQPQGPLTKQETEYGEKRKKDLRSVGVEPTGGEAANRRAIIARPKP